MEKARSIIISGLPFEPGTIATVLRPELSGLRTRATEQVSTSGVLPAGAERVLLDRELRAIMREITWIGYKMAKFLRRRSWNALHMPAFKQNPRFRTAPFYHMPAMHLAGWAHWA